MLPLGLLILFFFFIVLGSTAFVICLAVPLLRRYALSTALWFVACGLCFVALLMLAGLFLIAGSLGAHYSKGAEALLRRFAGDLGIGDSVAGVTLIVLVATAVSCLHQWLVARLTFPLFRLYAVTVSAGIGSVWGWLLNFTLLAYDLTRWHVASLVLAMAILCGGFGFAAYRWAGSLRGRNPKRLTWISDEEYYGLPKGGDRYQYVRVKAGKKV